LTDGSGKYASNTQCTWNIEAAGAITVVFTAFATEEDNDFVKIFDSTGVEAVASFSGHDVPPSFSTNSTSLTIVFTSDNGDVSDGFELEVFALGPGGTWAPTGAPTTGPTYAPDPGARFTDVLRHRATV
jgi:hypothetical protein